MINKSIYKYFDKIPQYKRVDIEYFKESYQKKCATGHVVNITAAVAPDILLYMFLETKQDFTTLNIYGLVINDEVAYRYKVEEEKK